MGVGEYVNLFEDPVETPEPQKIPTRAEKKEAKRTDKEEKQKNYIEEELLSCKHKTKFIIRIYNLDLRNVIWF